MAGYASVNDSLKISLITCSPGTQVYELFGHTGLRVRDDARDIDVVFHYGVFSFDTPNFIYRFTKGETDYSIGHHVIYAAFSWSVADEAYEKMKELAQKHGVGFYDVSGDDGDIILPDGNLME